MNDDETSDNFDYKMFEKDKNISTMPMMYIKKITSLNPTKYKYISLEKAIKGYEEYIVGYMQSNYYSSFEKPKTFKSWLTTEI